MNKILYELDTIFKHVFINYFLLLSSILSIINHSSLNSTSHIFMFFLSLWVLYTSLDCLYKYHIKKSIDIKGNKI